MQRWAVAPQLFAPQLAQLAFWLRLRLRRNFFHLVALALAPQLFQPKKRCAPQLKEINLAQAQLLDILMKSGSKQMTNEIIFKR